MSLCAQATTEPASRLLLIVCAATLLETALSTRPSSATENDGRPGPSGKSATPMCAVPPGVAAGVVPPATCAPSPTSSRGRNATAGTVGGTCAGGTCGGDAGVGADAGVGGDS